MAAFAISLKPRLNTKLLLIRFNRSLAWALLLSPALHIMGGTPFWYGIGIDLLLLLAHGLLSLALFGKPRSTAFRAQHGFHRFLGGQRDLLQGRERFLLDAWRILLSLFNTVSLTACAWLIMISPFLLLPLLWVLYLPLWSAVMFFQLLLAASLLRHVRDATAYAYRRWRIPANEALLLGWLSLGVFLTLTYCNLIKELL
jgi:hypothetical protein